MSPRITAPLSPASDDSAKTQIMDQATLRFLTPLECERLQSFPDGWTAGASEAQRHKQMGYAETVNAIKAVARWLAP